MQGKSLICTCGSAIHIDPDGTRTTCYDGSPHLDHSAYQEWAQRHGFTDESLGWLPQVLDYPASIRVQLVSDRLLWACGLIPGIDWAQYPAQSGRGTTTAGQPLSGFSADHPWDDLPKGAEPPSGRAETPERAEDDRSEGDGTPVPVSGPSVVKRFGGEEAETTPAKTAAKRWGE